MREFLNVLSYTFAENVKKKSFIISTVILLLITVGALSVPALINYFDNGGKAGVQNSTEQNGEEQKNKNTIYIIDEKGILKNNFSKLSMAYPNYRFKAEAAGKIDSLKKEAKEGKAAVIVMDEKNGEPYFDYWVKSMGNMPDASILSRVLQDTRTDAVLKDAGVTDSIKERALKAVSYNYNELGKSGMTGYIASFIVLMLIFFGIYFYGYGVAMSVASEKTSRVMEILITSTKPSRIVLGKSAAMGLLGLCQFLLIIVSAAATYLISFPPDFTIMGQRLDFSNFTPTAILMVVIYFLLGYSLFSMMNAVAGATVSKAEDVNSALMPLNMIILIAFYVSNATVGIPDGSIAVAASLIPFTAPFSMPCRILMTDVPIWQIAVSVAGMALTILVISSISIRLYSSAVLHYGKRLKIKELMKMSK